MSVSCVWEHNGDDTLLYCVDFPGAYTRGSSLQEAAEKIPAEVHSYCQWVGSEIPIDMEVKVVHEVACDLNVSDADSDVLFDSEKLPLTMEEYQKLKAHALKSARDFQILFDSVPDSSRQLSSARRTFYGMVPSSAEEMYLHTKNVNVYYFGEIGVDADNNGDILSCRIRGFDKLESMPDFLNNRVVDGSYGEQWSVRKMLRRFIWHDRIHAKAMYRKSCAIFGNAEISNVFFF